MGENKQFRHEQKYLINHRDKQLLMLRLHEIMKVDANAEDGMYKIRSLYFDDYWNTAYTEKMMGTTSRCKYRIRIYNDSDSNIKLERKEKQGSYIYKTSAPLTREETESLIAGDCNFLLYKTDNLYHQFYYQYVSRVMRPCVIVDYEREPYICEAGDVRITFDSNVRACSAWCDFFNPQLPCSHIFEEGKLVMEVKFTQFLPKIIQKAISCNASEFTAVSKFTGCFEKTAAFTPLIYNGVSQI